MLELIHAGREVMYVIILCSVVSLGLIIERFLAFRQARCEMQTFFPPLEKAIKLGKIDEAIQYCKKSPALIPQVLMVGLNNQDESTEDLRQILSDEIQTQTLPTLQRHLTALATIARGAPMLGLLGTVIGMIRAFQTMQQFGLGDPQKLTGDIGEALITTAGGLIVAIPIIFVHSYFKGQIRDFELELHHYLTRFLRVMNKRREATSDG